MLFVFIYNFAKSTNDSLDARDKQTISFVFILRDLIFLKKYKVTCVVLVRVDRKTKFPILFGAECTLRTIWSGSPASIAYFHYIISQENDNALPRQDIGKV